MVNRIDDNYITYTKTKNVNIPNTGEKFSLNYNKDELQAKDGEKKDKADKSEKDRKDTAEQSGVRLELSSNGKTSSVDRLKTTETSKTQASASGQSIVDMLREIVTTAISAVKDFFYKIWNEPDKVNESVDTEDSEGIDESMTMAEVPEIADKQPKETAEYAIQDVAAEAREQDMAAFQKMNEARLDREIQPYLRKGDLNQVISLLTDNGKKSVAMNSTLLTYYDRNGKMVEINASDRERILRGDRNTKRL
ncbi:MAG: hypothetical protein HDR12_16930 [Lachnospiraceae bacterium]|nr:hypothetical protein [Lachnospiraceae bacterium]